jgi:hypothetical protein
MCIGVGQGIAVVVHAEQSSNASNDPPPKIEPETQP